LARPLTKSVGELNPLDPHNINPRLQAWLSELIEARDEMSLTEQIRAISAIGRIQAIYVGLRKEAGGGYATGTEVKRFAKAFEQNAKGGRKSYARSSSAAVAALAYDDDDGSD
jgi:hypothetical protein